MPLKTIERLIKYRRLLTVLDKQNVVYCFSHQLAALAKNTPAQVRRDVMELGYTGTAQKGYVVKNLIEQISQALDPNSAQNIALVGVGNLGRAVLSYFSFQQPFLKIIAAFDNDESKTNRVISGCRCYHISELKTKVAELNIELGIITVPADQAQDVVREMADAGIKGFLNFAPVSFHLPGNVISEDLDITLKLQKLAFLVNQKNTAGEINE